MRYPLCAYVRPAGRGTGSESVIRRYVMNYVHGSLPGRKYRYGVLPEYAESTPFTVCCTSVVDVTETAAC